MKETTGKIVYDCLEKLLTLAKRGMVPKKLINDYILFDKYQKMDCPKMERYERLAMEYGIHWKTVQRTVLKFL